MCSDCSSNFSEKKGKRMPAREKMKGAKENVAAFGYESGTVRRTNAVGELASAGEKPDKKTGGRR